MSGEGKQKKLTRVRPPCVQNSYDLQIGEAIELKEEFPVTGVLSDIGSQPGQSKPGETEGPESSI